MSSPTSTGLPPPDEAGPIALAPPPAVAAIVTMGSQWSDTEATLRALAAQDYPRLAVLVLCDEGGAQAHRVREVLPTAAVANRTSSRRDRGRGPQRLRPGAVNNRGASLVRGADYLLFLSDRVALAPDAISVLIEDAENAQAESSASPAPSCWTPMTP